MLFKFDDAWTGGLYYLYNIINALNYLPRKARPELIIFYDDAAIAQRINAFCYPYIRFLPLQKQVTLIERILNRIWQIAFRKSYPGIYTYPANTADFLFPCVSISDGNLRSIQKLRKVYWIADFQHRYLPHFFSHEEVKARDDIFEKISELDSTLVLSSKSAEKDFCLYYPNHKVHKKTLPFATVLPPFDDVDFGALKSKYNIDNLRYFISPNQFWAHKNHIVILKAALLVLKTGLEFQIIFTGKETDYRNPDYTSDLKRFVVNNGIENHVKFLGFIERTDQLRLMEHAVAVIQPSLFEGWSTVVEDTKAINNRLILSNLDVHKEQCGNLASYFDPKNENELAELMILHLNLPASKPFPPYKENISRFAGDILSL